VAENRNAEIVRASYDALNRGDIAGALEPLDPDVEWRESPVLPESDTYKGLDAVRGLLLHFLDSWDEFRQEVEESMSERDRVLVFLHLSARGRESGVAVDAHYAHLWTMAEGKAVRVDAFYDRAEALEALAAGSERTAP
jgi:ketosteroid isomerase-like protein